MSEVTTYHELTVLRAKVERLEAENARFVAGGCARDQTTTQFCAEAVALQAEVTRLREALRAVVACWEVPTYGNSSDKLDIVFDAVELARAALGETNEPA